MPSFTSIWSCVLLVVGVQSLVSAQCALPDPLPIRDQAANIDYLRVEGLNNAVLGNAGQGICQINIRFSHASVGDVALDLSAPNGRIYRLIAPSGARPTDGTIWDIAFVSCSDDAQPDAGTFIKPQWDSDQDWGQNEQYTGRYYPVTCLEDINTGPANGIWSLTVSDITEQGVGEIEDFELIFCDPTGIECQDCQRYGSRIVRDTTSFCGGEPALQSVVVDYSFNGVPPDPGVYEYTFIVIHQGLILQIGDQPDLSGQPRGDYLIYGLTIDRSDLGLLQTYVGGSFGALANALNPRKLELCGTLSSGLKVFRILSDASTRVSVQAFVCAEAPIPFGNRLITEPGIYLETFTSVNGCDSLVELRVMRFELNTGIADPGVIGCTNKPLTLEWENNQFGENPRYAWSTRDGSILSDPGDRQISIDLPGTYNLAVSLNGCSDSTSITIGTDGSLPTLDLEDLVMDCMDNIGRLRPVSNANAFRWSGPFGFSSNDQNIDVTEPGRYTLIATGTNCAVRKTISVSADFDTPEGVQVAGGTIRCANDTVQLSAASSSVGAVYNWSGPNGFSSLEAQPRVTQPGFYTVRISAPDAGCTIQEEVEVVSIFEPPVINITGGTLTCGAPRRRISTSINDNLSTFQWSGPDGFTSSEQSPLVQVPGDYTVTITDSRQCSYIRDAIVSIDTVRPTVTVSDQTLGCADTDFNLTASVFSLNAPSYTWVGPNNYRANTLNASASQPGDYTLIVLDPVNRCSSRATMAVREDPDRPQLLTTNGVINCAQPIDTLIADATCVGGCALQWSGPNGFMASEESVSVAVPGAYQVEVTDTSNGCLTRGTFWVRADTIPINRNVRITPIGCTTPGQLQLVNSNVIPDITWTDSVTGQVFMDPVLRTPIPGTYYLYSTDRNGCHDTMRYTVSQNDAVPDIRLLMDTLDCANDRVRIGVELSNYPIAQIRQYTWTLPDGSLFEDQIPTIADSGRIELSVTMSNGCVGSTTGRVQTDYSTPQFQATGGGFRCRDRGINLSFDAVRQPILFHWTGPNAFSSSQPSPLAQVPGLYRLEILGANGCPAEDTAMVWITDQLPEVMLAGDTINCLDTVGTLTFTTSAGPGYSFKWLDPGGRLDSISRSIATTLTGMYQLEVVDTNDCVIVTDAIIAIDTITFGHQIASSLISCLEPMTTLNLDTIYPFLQYTWLLDSAEVASGPMPMVDRGGGYTLVARNTNGCSRRIPHVVEADTLAPQFELNPDTLNCSASRLTLRPTLQDRSWIYDWSGPGAFRFDGATPLVDVPGVYTLSATATNGCTSVRQTLISSDFNYPDLVVRDTFLPCNSDSVVLGFRSDAHLEESNWFGPNGFYTGDSLATTEMPGNYYIIIKAPNGCQVVDSVWVNADPTLQANSLLIQHIDCAHMQGEIRIENVRDDYVYNWFVGAVPVVADTAIFVNTAEIVMLNTEHLPTGCILMDTINIKVDTLRPQLQILELDSIICQHRTSTLGSVVDTLVQYQWSALSGRILGADSLAQMTTDRQGEYTLIVEARHNHCTSSQTFAVLERPDNLMGFSAMVSHADCHGLDNGVVTIQDINGGTAPYEYSIDPSYFISDSVFSFLAPGDYQLQVNDLNGCSHDTVVTIDRVPLFTAELTSDFYLLDLGDSLQLDLFLSLGPGQTDQIEWLLPFALDCDTCRSVSVSPIQNSFVYVNVTSIDGCTLSDTALIRVSDREGLFIPNVFTPNDDGFNDLLEVFTGDNIQSIKRFEVYDRWGNNVFSAFDYLPGESGARWDGTYRGEALQPAVFIYQVEAVDILGKVKIKTGDVVLVR